MTPKFIPNSAKLNWNQQFDLQIKFILFIHSVYVYTLLTRIDKMLKWKNEKEKQQKITEHDMERRNITDYTSFWWASSVFNGICCQQNFAQIKQQVHIAYQSIETSTQNIII